MQQNDNDVTSFSIDLFLERENSLRDCVYIYMYIYIVVFTAASRIDVNNKLISCHFETKYTIT